MRANVRLLACVALLVGLPANVAAAKDKITVVMSSFDLLFWPTLAAKELGYFDAENIDPDIVRTGGGAKSLAAVAGGDAHFNIGAPASAFRARAKGSDVMMIARVRAIHRQHHHVGCLGEEEQSHQGELL